jgi:Ca2+-binding EF-hand superfamily protein
MIRQMFDVADENGDDKLEMHEFSLFSNFVIEGCQGLKLTTETEELPDLFARVDANNDGTLDWEEIWT